MSRGRSKIYKPLHGRPLLGLAINKYDMIHWWHHTRTKTCQSESVYLFHIHSVFRCEWQVLLLLSWLFATPEYKESATNEHPANQGSSIALVTQGVVFHLPAHTPQDQCTAACLSNSTTQDLANNLIYRRKTSELPRKFAKKGANCWKKKKGKLCLNFPPKSG